jgi:hypothetical protein
MPLAIRVIDRLRDLADVDFASFGDRELMVWDVASGKFMGGVATLSAAGRLGAVGADLTGTLSLSDVNVVLGTTTGTKFGTATSQKLAFFNATPIVQPTSTTDLRAALINLGLYASGGATPLDLNGGALSAGSLTWSSGTTGSVLFVDGSGLIAQDNANLFWDASNKRLAVGNVAPQAPVHFTITNTTTNANSSAMVLEHALSSGTAAASMGVGIRFMLPSTTTPGQSAGILVGAWADPAHATKRGRISLFPANPAGSSIEGLRVEMQTDGVNSVYLPGAPPALTTTAKLLMGTVGTLSGGSSSGTFVGINAGSGYAGNLLHFQINGADRVTITAAGRLAAIGADLTGTLFLSDVDLVLGTTTGTKIGTATSQKLGFFNATPIIQPIGTTDLRTALINLGLYASGGASPLNLNGGAFTAATATLSGMTAGSVIFAGTAGLLSQDTSNFVWDDTSNQLLLGTGSVGNPSYSFAGDANTGMYRIGADILGFATAGVEGMRLSATGRLGLGVAPTYRLQVRAEAGNDNLVQFEDENGNARLIMFASTGNVFWNAVPSTALATSQNSASLNFMSTRWNGSVSVNEGFTMLAVRYGDYAGGVAAYFQDNDGAKIWAGSGAGGQLAVGYDFPSSGALPTLGQFHARSRDATYPAATFYGAASQSANIWEGKKSDGTVYGTMSENGYWTTRKVAAPADAEIEAGEAAYWLDATNGASKFKIKAKSANGTVVTGEVALA